MNYNVFQNNWTVFLSLLAVLRVFIKFYLSGAVIWNLLMLIVLAESLMNLNGAKWILTNFFMFLFFCHVVKNTVVILYFVLSIDYGVWLLGSVWILEMVLISLKIRLCISLSHVFLRLACLSVIKNILSCFLQWEIISGMHQTILNLLVKHLSMVE